MINNSIEKTLQVGIVNAFQRPHRKGKSDYDWERTRTDITSLRGNYKTGKSTREE